MENHNESNKPSIMFPDPFTSSAFPNPASTNATPTAPPNPLISAAGSNLFHLASPTLSTPARLPFNPDDFLISPPHPPPRASHRSTPELKRRLFVPSDNPATPAATCTPATPGAASSSTPLHTSSLPFHTLSPDQMPSPNASFMFSPTRPTYLADLLPVHAPSSRLNTPAPLNNVLDTPIAESIEASRLTPAASTHTPTHSHLHTHAQASNVPKQHVQLPRHHAGGGGGGTLVPLPMHARQQVHGASRPFGETRILPMNEELLTPGSTLDPTNSSLIKTQSTSSKFMQRASDRQFTGKQMNPSAMNPRSMLVAHGQAPPPPPPPPELSPMPTTPFTPAAAGKVKCSCKASRCLKLYCLCFAGSGFCSDECSCKNCHNTVDTRNAVHEARDTVLARDPRAFDPKVRPSVAGAAASGGRGASTTVGASDASKLQAANDIHAKGCNCRKGCSKKYCVCRELRVECGPRCTCSGPKGCQNRSGGAGCGEGSTNCGAVKAIAAGPAESVPLLGSIGGLDFMGADGSSSGRFGVMRTGLEVMDAKGFRPKQRLMMQKKVKKRVRNEDGKKDMFSQSDDGGEEITGGYEKRAKVVRSMAMCNGSGSLLTCGGIGDGPIQALELVGLDIDKSPVVGANDDVEKFREVTGEIAVKRRVGSGEVISHVVEEVLSKTKAAGGGKDGGAGGVGGSQQGGRGKGGERGAEGVKVFGREGDAIDLCRLPRILRLKMGSGRMINSKFGM